MTAFHPDVIHIGPCSLEIPARFGGAVERRMWEIAQVQVKSGLSVQLFSLGQSDEDEMLDGVLISRVAIGTCSSWAALAFLRKCAARVRSEHAVLHFHNMPEAAWIFRRFPNPTLLAFDFPRFRRGRRTPLFLFYRWCLVRFDLLLPVSEFCKAAAAAYWFLPLSAFHVVHNGVNLEQFQPAPDLRAEFRHAHGIGNAVLLAYAGRVNEQKGTGLLLDSYVELQRSFPELRLAICGPPGQFGSKRQTDLTARIAEVGGLYLGDVSERTLTSLYNAADLFILPTRRDEMFGMVAVEAQACGTPIVCSDTGGLPEVVSTRSGSFFQSGSSRALTETVSELLHRPERLAACREHARANAARFGWEKIGHDLEAAYALAARTRKPSNASGPEPAEEVPMPERALRIALVGGIYGKPQEYRDRFRITPETTLEAGLRAAGAEVSIFDHYTEVEGDFDVIHVHHLSWGAVRAAVQRSAAGFVFTAHNGEDIAGTLSRVRRTAMAFAIKRADGVVALSELEAAFLRSNYDTAGAVTRTIPNGIDLDNYRMDRTNSAGRDTRWELLYVGQLIPWKRVDLLLRAVAKVRLPITLNLVYQNAELEPELKQLAQQLHIEEHVHFLGMKNPAELCALYNHADLFVLPSESEALPSVLTEAMLTGTPIVATETGGVRGQLGGFGRLVPPSDLQSLAHGIEDALLNYAEMNPASLKMSEYARNTFSRTAMIGKHLELYARVLERGRKRRQRPAFRVMNLVVEKLLSAYVRRPIVPQPQRNLKPGAERGHRGLSAREQP